MASDFLYPETTLVTPCSVACCAMAFPMVCPSLQQLAIFPGDGQLWKLLGVLT